jgi:hypothetical protein
LIGIVEVFATGTSVRGAALAAVAELFTAPAVTSRVGTDRLGGAVSCGSGDGASALPGVMIEFAAGFGHSGGAILDQCASGGTDLGSFASGR